MREFSDMGYTVLPRVFSTREVARLRLAFLRLERRAQSLSEPTLVDGSLFVTDSAAGTLWTLRPGERRLARVGEAGGLRGANGVAVAPDGTVYVTLSTGIARVQPRTGHTMRLPQPDDIATGGRVWRVSSPSSLVLPRVVDAHPAPCRSAE